MTMKAVRFIIAKSLVLFSMSFAAAQTLEEGVSLLESEKFAESRAIFKSLIAKNPAASEPYYYLGESFYVNDNIDSAKYYFNKGIEMNSKNGFCYAGLGKIQLDRKEKESDRTLEKAYNYSKKNAKSYVATARAYIDGDFKNPNRAIEILSPLTADYKDPAIFETLADAYVILNDGGKAMTQYQFASDKDKNNPKYYLKRAQIWMNAKVYEEAIKELDNVIALKPNYAPAYKKLIDIYNIQGKYAKVTPLLEKYTNLVGSDLDAKESFAKFLWFQAKNYDKSIEEAKKVLAQDTNRVQMYRFLSMSYFEKGDFQNAYDNMKKFLDNAGDRKIYSSDYEYLAKAAEKLNMKDVSATYYLKVVEMDSTRTDIYDSIAKSYRESKNYKKALDIYNLKLSKVAKPVANDYYYIGLNNYYLDQYIQADSAFAKYCELYPNTSGYNFRARIAKILDPESKEWKALPFYEKIVELGEKDKDKNKKNLIESYNYIAAYTYNVVKDVTKAKEIVQKSLDLDPENALAKEMMSNMK
ncbi:MAG: tetratricopeptide repeat protein [Saprospiraceae bacterium]|nr:tetratricopeptide repeat protein [Saprospiraceae bacterium]